MSDYRTRFIKLLNHRKGFIYFLLLTFLRPDSEISLQEDSGNAVTTPRLPPASHGRHLVGVGVAGCLREADGPDVGVSGETEGLCQLQQTHVIVKLSSLAIARVHFDLGHGSLKAVRLTSLTPVMVSKTHL